MRKLILSVMIIIGLSVSTVECIAKPKATHKQRTSMVGYTVTGMASYYGSESGSRTATGEHFNPMGLTAAHRTLPLPTMVKVTNLNNNRSVVVKVNDRGPFVGGRVLDVSKGAAIQLGMINSGTARVRVVALN